MRQELEQYLVDAPLLWQGLPVLGLDGFGVIDFVKHENWEAIGDWGKKGWTLGHWPLVIIFFRDRADFFDVIEYVEGDANMYACPTAQIREEITNELAFFHWKAVEREWVAPYNSVEELPPEFKGPYEWRDANG